MELLKDNFGRPQIIKNSHLRKIINLSPIQHSDHESLTKFLNELEKRFRSLKILNFDVADHNEVFSPLIEKKHPTDLIIVFNRSRGQTRDTATLSEILDFLKVEIAFKPKMAYSKTEISNNFDKKDIKLKSSFSTLTIQNTNTQCLFCNKDHVL